ncbi:tetratricopeptide (TPR) repeat protein [Kibdelosporangium banguiense]|uniref:Tetratricopeptide (TPR) repeat protein n=1 Tax=Kibdelosporangium banguiense TaxID=1365924 RepID=A0ABS4T5Y1_9PSEU|nr:CHAT domain-containing protein [Kibdelosporangium banguiense]MBP2319872.1 tetratricopeptide (TPR) repeat protein [Kibdelosporangium banguiense]
MSQDSGRVRELHQRGLNALNRGRPLLGARAFRAGLRIAPDDVRLLNSLAAAEAALGDTEQGFALLDRADALATADTKGLLLQQRGLLLVLVGRMDDALACLDQAIPLLRREQTVLARTLLNRAMLHQIAGRVTPALADLDRCERLAQDLGLPRLVAKAVHGRGSCQLLTGNIPAALRDFDSARSVYQSHADGMLAVVAVERARALLAAGLHSDAATELDFALREFPRIRMDQEHAEAQLTRAQVALAAGDLTTAKTWASRAESRFRRRGNETWAAVAAATRLRAEFKTRTRLGAVAAHASSLADRLASLGLDNDAEAAGLVAARAYIARGRTDEARQHIRPRSGSRSLLETRLMRRLALAELGSTTGDRRATFTHARAGLALLRDHRSRVGSLDLRTSTTSLGRELARTGLAAALAHGAAPVVFGWMERSRAQAFRFQPVRPPDDDTTIEAVAELRQLAHQVRAAELAGNPDQEARRRCGQLERAIRARGWHAEGVGEHRAEATFAQVRAALAGTTMISYAASDGRLWALVITRRRTRLVELADLATVSESLAKLHSDLDASCGRQLPAALDNVIKASIRRQLDALTAGLLEPVRPMLADNDVVIVPTGALSAVPWGLLPDMTGRPVTVSPSASTWLTGSDTGLATPSRWLLVAGPDLAHANDEVLQLAKVYGDGAVLLGPDATVQSTLEALDGCTTAHFATHGHHERENVLFSRLDLSDGPLMAYDIHQLRSAPAHVVLSSCDVGQTVVRNGDEILGFTAALLYSGTRTVVSSVASVDDDAAVGVMAAYHRGLVNGLRPAHALADATAAQPMMPFVCFGSS